IPGWAADDSPPVVRIGSKKFTESVILGEMIAHLVRSAGGIPDHRRELGGTEILWQALLRGEIDVYPEYTGTLSQVVLKDSALRDEEQLRAALAQHGVRMSRPLGFNNTYAIGVPAELARERGLRRISDLRHHPDLKFGFSDEFMNRPDGWPGLRDRYGLPQRDVRGIDHDLAYRGLQSGHLHATDLYSTDAEIRYYRLHVLEDDLGHFPSYQAVLLYRADLEERAPAVVQALARLEGRISEAAMVEMNSRAKLKRVRESHVAATFLNENLGLQIQTYDETPAASLLRHTVEHLQLVGISLAAAIVVAVPLGIVAAHRPSGGQVILGVAGVIQTIPSLALLVFLIPLLGIGGLPAVVALFLYSLLPIVRNTYAGLHDIPVTIRESAEALGLPAAARLRLVELPMAARAILAGIKTAAVINVGTATLGALIGAGGYGQPILTGIRLDDTGLILQGAVPAALLALLMQGLFEAAERLLVPRGLRLRPAC
ncbi:MAG TPA: glycine betaine ABC transporter substrate-binding protein, partial [Gemmataceae bacterium]|nr:glycine betaine ABC transporter substrate-binding protein [Gemmataceae bacterium]